MQKPKEHLQLAVCLHSKAIESITTRKSHMCSLLGVLSQSLEISEWFTGFAVWSVAELRHLRCLMPAVQMSGQTISCSICCTEYQPLSIVWLPWISCCLPGENLPSLSCTRVLCCWLWAFLICFCCKTHTQLLSYNSVATQYCLIGINLDVRLSKTSQGRVMSQNYCTITYHQL